MSINTLILRNPNEGEAQVKPSKLPAKIVVVWDGTGGMVYYGTDGGPADIPLQKGVPTTVLVNINTMHLKWQVGGQSKIQWEE